MIKEDGEVLTLKLVRLIEKHSQELVGGLTEQVQLSERTSDFRKIPAAELELAAAEVSRNLGEGLLQKTDEDIESRFRAIGARRAAEGVGLHQFVWALITSRDHLCHFLQREAFACNVVELYGELELYQMLTQFFDRAVCHGILGIRQCRTARHRNERATRRIDSASSCRGFFSVRRAYHHSTLD